MLPELISKIYVINLEHSIERKNHIKKEFANIGINNYEFFQATDKDDQQVQDMLKTNFVKKFPPCFRCNENRCWCQNNVLIKQQIGNWCSFINVMKDIIKNDYRDLIMICEDDIKFTNDSKYIFNKMITRNHLEKYKISFSKPILIRAEQRGNFPILKNLNFTKKIVMSNACFLINKYFAKSFLDNLKVIDATSDQYIHIRLLNIDKNIQHLTIEPSPIYQLSDKPNGLNSLIHPKGINKEDIIAKHNHIKKLEYKEFLCIGHPRCGTTSISSYLTQKGYDVKHEHMGYNGISSWMFAVADNNYPYGNAKNRLNYYFKNIIHVVRNPFDAIPSIILENKYSPDNLSYKFRKKHIKNILNIDLPDVDLNKISLLDDTELAIKTFIYWNKICELCKPTIIYKIEALNIGKKNSNKRYGGKIYEKPNISNDIYKKIDDNLKQELQNFCKKYNYEFLL
jgi:GR25 family glycosyltransferase involved in LPS biosynthesis